MTTPAHFAFEGPYTQSAIHKVIYEASSIAYCCHMQLLMCHFERALMLTILEAFLMTLKPSLYTKHTLHSLIDC